jgi:hypothetical protein
MLDIIASIVSICCCEHSSIEIWYYVLLFTIKKRLVIHFIAVMLSNLVKYLLYVCCIVNAGENRG